MKETYIRELGSWNRSINELVHVWDGSAALAVKFHQQPSFWPPHLWFKMAVAFRLQNLFWQMDDDESGTLTAEEMQQLVKDWQLQFSSS